jgi:hypothetical protein
MDGGPIMGMRYLLIPAILLISGPVWAQGSTCGLLNVKAIHVVPHYPQVGECQYEGQQFAPPASIGGT